MTTFEQLLFRKSVPLKIGGHEYSGKEINVEEITQNPIERMTVKELNSQLKDAIDNEDYESASRLRDEINKRKKN